jgi:hypothetical protein
MEEAPGIENALDVTPEQVPAGKRHIDRPDPRPEATPNHANRRPGSDDGSDASPEVAVALRGLLADAIERGAWTEVEKLAGRL